MDEIIRRYKGATTSQGHKLEVTRDGEEVTIAFKHLGEHGDEYDPYVRVARIQEIGGIFRLSVFYLDAEEPTVAGDYNTERDLISTLDEALEARSQEFGPIEN
jgi:hypothetical protein